MSFNDNFILFLEIRHCLVSEPDLNKYVTSRKGVFLQQKTLTSRILKLFPAKLLMLPLNITQIRSVRQYIFI